VAARLRLVLFYTLGFGVLAALIYRMPFRDVTAAIHEVGPGLFWVFLAGPLFWVATASSLYLLSFGQVPWLRLMGIQAIADSYNCILPLAGLGGEPLKVHWMSKWIGLNPATRAVLTDRMLHVIPGPLFAAVVLPIVAYQLPTDKASTKTSYYMAAAVMTVLVIAMLWAAFSPLPGRFSNWLLARLFKNLTNAPGPRVSRPRLFAAFWCKFGGQVVLVLEAWLTLYLFGFEASAFQVLAVSATLTMSAIIFFFIPQQIGVNEAGLAATFTLLGLPPHLGLAMGLVRRARQTFWPLFGLALHGVVWTSSLFNRRGKERDQQKRAPQAL
jgi:hypothetical protein